MTHRQFVAWQGWYQEEYNRPSRTDWYLMLIAHYVEVQFAGNKAKRNLAEYKIPFSDQSSEDDEAPGWLSALTMEQRIELDKQIVAARIGANLPAKPNGPKSSEPRSS